jgi:uncharacterized protein (DUF427 family)
MTGSETFFAQELTGMSQFPMTPDRKNVLERYPEYSVLTRPASESVIVVAGEETVAKSKSALVIEESFHAPVYYLPRADVRLELFERTGHSTYCPFKGHASYWSLQLPELVEENVVWSYEDPFVEVVALKDYLAFYNDRPTIEIISTQ